jgi:Flp pilus assembly CpaF family ATPase
MDLMETQMTNAERYECIPAHLQEHPEDQVDSDAPVPNFEDTLEARFLDAQRVQAARPAPFAAHDLIVVRKAAREMAELREQLANTAAIAEEAGRALRAILDGGYLRDAPTLSTFIARIKDQCEALR